MKKILFLLLFLIIQLQFVKVLANFFVYDTLCINKEVMIEEQQVPIILQYIYKFEYSEVTREYSHTGSTQILYQNVYDKNGNSITLYNVVDLDVSLNKPLFNYTDSIKYHRFDINHIQYINKAEPIILFAKSKAKVTTENIQIIEDKSSKQTIYKEQSIQKVEKTKLTKKEKEKLAREKKKAKLKAKKEKEKLKKQKAKEKAKAKKAKEKAKKQAKKQKGSSKR